VDGVLGGLGIVVNFATAGNRYHPGFWVGEGPVATAIQP
jgi:hypothetical protein